MKKLIYICLAITFITVSCTVQKRVYNSGYHVKWKGGNLNSDKNEFEAKVENQEENSILASSKNEQVKEILAENNSSVINNTAETVDINLVEENQVKVKPVATNDTKVSKTKASERKEKSFSKAKVIKKAVKKSKADDTTILLYILCFFLPPIAVGLATNWEEKTLIISIILTLLCFIPGIIHALIVVSDNR
jgi:uncharacterized membrane protein YqaE (UPF0057 family)